MKDEFWMLNGIDERQISKTHPVKVRFFSGARIRNMYHYIVAILEKKPEHLILHVGQTMLPIPLMNK